jgi:hypothetical protein
MIVNEGFNDFLQSFQAVLESYLKLGHDCLRPHSLQFIIQ